jgi:hypothetical protein
MAVTNHRVASYQYEVRQEPGRGQLVRVSVLYLYGDRKNLLAMFVFHDGEGPPDLPQQTEAGHITAQFPKRELAALIDMLRNEKPVYFSWTLETQSVRVSTDEEPVGEQELRKLLSWLYI